MIDPLELDLSQYQLVAPGYIGPARQELIERLKKQGYEFLIVNKTVYAAFPAKGG